MSEAQTRLWKILCFGRGEGTAQKAEEYLHESGYKNIKVVGIENDKASDDKIIELLKQDDWIAVSFGKNILSFIFT